MLDQCSETTRDLLAVAACVATLSIVASVRALIYMARIVRRIRVRIDSERAILADHERRIRDGEEAEREGIRPTAPR